MEVRRTEGQEGFKCPLCKGYLVQSWYVDLDGEVHVTVRGARNDTERYWDWQEEHPNIKQG